MNTHTPTSHSSSRTPAPFASAPVLLTPALTSLQAAHFQLGGGGHRGGGRPKPGRRSTGGHASKTNPVADLHLDLTH
ncbi:hypothetical protein E2C01_009992 [Portunus trituberculatus]|uniref:Uncharacterized protein n=1 Tax=Portunus trituberculatus TaxID=210409 RepID=A0A5B7D7A0_PORTR|nr:hypothetical protein [Portunus trituberculatus]